LPLDVFAHVPEAPALVNVNALSNVKVVVTCYNNPPVNTDLAALTAASPVPLGLMLQPGAQGDGGTPATVGNCSATFKLESTGVHGSSASVGSFNIDFTGVQEGTTPAAV
jgi:hypothetical protein